MARVDEERRQEYRRYAAECLALAQRAQNPHDRSRLLEMAQAFNELAGKSAPGGNPSPK